MLVVALVAGYFYLNNQVISQSSYTQKQLEQALEDNKVVDATIQQNREVPTGAVIVDTTDDGQRKVYVTDVNAGNRTAGMSMRLMLQHRMYRQIMSS